MHKATAPNRPNAGPKRLRLRPLNWKQMLKGLSPQVAEVAQ